MRLFKTTGLQLSEVSCRREMHGGRTVAVGNLKFVEKMKSEKKGAASRNDF